MNTNVRKEKCSIRREVGQVEHIDPYGYAWRVVRNDPDVYEVERDWMVTSKPSEEAYYGTDTWFIREGIHL